ncbi:MAG: hypothetical protein IIW85_02830, partial [Bacteroidaceae bacterium]|nr:hypothetical protein [Bacteroidaceae bacterium]
MFTRRLEISAVLAENFAVLAEFSISLIRNYAKKRGFQTLNFALFFVNKQKPNTQTDTSLGISHLSRPETKKQA